MLQSISWYQFISFIASAAGLYYAGTVLYFYSHEIRLLLRGEFNSLKASIPSVRTISGNLMGQTRRASQRATDEADNETDDALLGTVSDLVEEIKVTINTAESLTRDKIKPLIQPLLAKYPALLGTHYQHTISLFIADAITDKAGYLVERAEVNAWWPAIAPSESKQTN